MRLALRTASLRETTIGEYCLRFLFGGLLTVCTTLITNRWGPVVGGIFLAFPGIFPAGVTLIEKHKIKREAQEGKVGVVSARGQASVEAAGAVAGTVGLAAFGFVLWKEIASHSLLLTLASATILWAIVSGAAWLLRDRHSSIRQQSARS